MSYDNKKRTSVIVVKPVSDEDSYVLWDGVREEPFWCGPREATRHKLSERSKDDGVYAAVDRLLERVDAAGTSLHYPSQTGEFLYGYHEDPLLFRGEALIARERLPELTRRLRKNEDVDDLLKGLTATAVDATVDTPA